ncbi:twin-arginine translocation signal domain-containing protein [Planctellipticum variicoloris]
MTRRTNRRDFLQSATLAAAAGAALPDRT